VLGDNVLIVGPPKQLSVDSAGTTRLMTILKRTQLQGLIFIIKLALNPMHQALDESIAD
jgi:hypothetical protein